MSSPVLSSVMVFFFSEESIAPTPFLPHFFSLGRSNDTAKVNKKVYSRSILALYTHHRFLAEKSREMRKESFLSDLVASFAWMRETAIHKSASVPSDDFHSLVGVCWKGKGGGGKRHFAARRFCFANVEFPIWSCYFLRRCTFGG